MRKELNTLEELERERLPREDATLDASARTHLLAEAPDANPESRIFENAGLLWACRGTLGKALLAGLLAGMVAALLVRPRYESTAQLMPPDSQSASGMAALAALASKSSGGMGMAGDLLGARSSGALFVGILHSRTIQDRIVERFHLKDVYGDRLDEDARRELAENSGASEDRKTGIITLTVSDRERERAREMAAAYVEELNRLSAELSTSAAHRERVFLEERLVSVKRDLDQATRELSEFSSQNATVDVSAQAKALVEGAASLQGEMIAAEAQRQSLETIYTANNVRVRAAQARVNEIRKELERLGGSEDTPEPQPSQAKTFGVPADPVHTSSPVSGVPPSQAPLSEAPLPGGPTSAGQTSTGQTSPGQTSVPSLFSNSYSYPSLRQLPLLGAKYADLYRSAKIQEAVFETLTQQYEIAKVQEAKETPSVKILDDASLPERRTFPPRTLMTGMCGLLGLIAASVWLLGERRWRSTDDGNLRKRFVMEVFHDMNSMMPWASPNGSRWQGATHKVWIRMGSLRPQNCAAKRKRRRESEREPGTGQQQSPDEAETATEIPAQNEGREREN
ncbi:MAG: hypothetical protein WBS24_14280 [Terriglobales bacterium]